MNGIGSVCIKKETIFIMIDGQQVPAQCACAKCEK
jgi:hypothetical protein